MGSTTAQKAIDTALSANAATLALPYAGNIFRELTNSTYKIDVNLTPKQRSILDAYLEVPVLYAGGKNVSHDHPTLVAMRDLVRTMYEDAHHMSKTDLITLVVGSAWREVKKYVGNPNINHHIHGGEAKDVERTAVKALEEIQKALKVKVTKKTKRGLALHAGAETRSGQAMVARYVDITKIVSDAVNLGVTAETLAYVRVGAEITRAQVLSYQDSFYNLTGSDFVSHFEKSGATTGHGYGLLPLDLVFPDMPENELYRISKCGNDATITFKYGYCNGYTHNADAWATLLRSPVIVGKSFDIVIEISARVGPFAVFSLTKTTSSQTIVRSVSIPDKFRYTRVLDVIASFDPVNKKFNPIFFSVLESEVVEVVNYLYSIDSKSRAVETAMTFIRRRAGGVSLVTQQLLAPWSLPSTKFRPLALAATLFVERETTDEVVALDVAARESSWEKVCRFFSLPDTGIGGKGKANHLNVMLPFYVIKEFLFRNRKLDVLIKFMDDEHYQIVKTNHHTGAVKTNFEVLTNLADGLVEEAVVACEFCVAMKDRLGKQKLICSHRESSLVVMEMTQKMLDDLSGNLKDTLDDPPTLAALKKQVDKERPQLPFKKEVVVKYIRGGPGTGKSTVIRLIADKDEDFIYVPFARLIPDYQGIDPKDGNGREKEKYDLMAKTTHKAILDVRGRKRMFVDEFSSMPYEYIMMVAQLSGVSEVYLVGDHKQTKVREPLEGLYIGNYVELEELDMHELVVNFRNGRDAVAWQNKMFGYKMEANSKLERTFKVCKAGEVPSDGKAILDMTFSRATKALNDGSATVRSQQGVTADTVSLKFSASDLSLVDMQEMAIVAGSRHVSMCYIEDDGSEPAKKFIAMLDLEDLWANTESYLYHHDESTLAKSVVKKEDKEFVDLVKASGRTQPIHQCSEHPDEFVRSLDESLNCPCGEVEDKFEADQFDIEMFSYDSDASDDDDTPYIPKAIDRRNCDNSGDHAGPSGADKKLGKKEEKIIDLTAGKLPKKDDDVKGKGKEKQEMVEAPPKDAKVVTSSTKLPRFPRISNVTLPVFDSISFSPTSTTKEEPESETSSHIAISIDGDDTESSLSGPISKPREGNSPYVRVTPNGIEYVSDSSPWASRGSAEYQETATMLTTSVRTDTKPKVEVGEPELPPEKSIFPGFDSYRLMETLIPTASQLNEGPMNTAASTQINPVFSSGVVGADLLAPINARGHPKNMVSEYHAFSAGSGVHFSGNQPFQTLQSLQARYLTKNKIIPGINDKDILARTMVEEFWDDHMVEGAQRDDLDYNLIMREFFSAADSKKYPEQFKGFDNPDARVVRYHMKEIFKPAKGGNTPKMEKPGQGISAWNKDAQILFGAVMRCANADFQNRTKPHMVYDNRMSEEEARGKLSQAIRLVDANAMNAMTDGVMFDANQDEFTQLIEKHHHRKLGMSEATIALYYSFREKYKIISDVGAGEVEWKKTSGEPGTLFNNSLVAGTFTNYLFRGEGPMAMAMKGDDGFKRQVNIKVNHDRVAEVQRFTVLRMECLLSQQAEFCGNAIIYDRVYPSVSRKLAKVAAHKFKNYKHFAEYQKSLRDWVTKTTPSQFELIAVNASLYSTSFTEMKAIYETVVSLAHINEDQFNHQFPRRVERMMIPRADRVDVEM